MQLFIYYYASVVMYNSPFLFVSFIIKLIALMIVLYGGKFRTCIFFFIMTCTRDITTYYLVRLT